MLHAEFATVRDIMAKRSAHDVPALVA